MAGTGTDRITGFENAKGGAAADILYGSGAANVLEGNTGADQLISYGGNERLDGGVSLGNLIGGTGRDILIAAAGADYFHFTSRTDSGTTAASRDVITDFEDRQDRIALDRIDAKAGSSAKDAFSFIGTNVAFSGHAGEIRSFYTAKGQRVEGDTNGDGMADFSVALQNATPTIGLSEVDFLL